MDDFVQTTHAKKLTLNANYRTQRAPLDAACWRGIEIDPHAEKWLTRTRHLILLSKKDFIRVGLGHLILRMWVNHVAARTLHFKGPRITASLKRY